MKKIFLISVLALLGMTQAAAQDNYLQLVREGVKWVNEKVIIDHGDTTSYYYVYEILGDDPDWHWYQEDTPKLCHYYTGNHIEANNDSIISSLGLRDGGTTIACFNNWAYDKVEQENRNILMRMFWFGMDEG